MLKISVIIPAYQSREHLIQCLRYIDACAHRPHEVIVVDDGSRDESAEAAKATGALVVRIDDGPKGPATARNRGAAIATGDILLFLDADVAVHRRTIDQVSARFERHPEVAAIFGSYDDKPAAGTFVSRYRNLLHHFVHQEGRREATTFWAGCGAVRRSVFQAIGGFDERFSRPSIEDIELGGRLRAAGYRVWLCPDILVRHLKRWTFAGVVRTDIVDRAIPWTRLILQHGQLPSDLNTATRSRISAVAAWMLVLGLPVSVFVRPMAILVVASVVVLAALNARLYRLFFGRGGLRFVCTALAMHVLYLLYSSAVFATLAAGAWWRPGRTTSSRRSHRPAPRDVHAAR